MVFGKLNPIDLKEKAFNMCILLLMCYGVENNLKIKQHAMKQILLGFWFSNTCFAFLHILLYSVDSNLEDTERGNKCRYKTGHYRMKHK